MMNVRGGGEQALPIVRTLPGQILGPGHHSVVHGRDSQKLFSVYHRWMAVHVLDLRGCGNSGKPDRALDVITCKAPVACA